MTGLPATSGPAPEAAEEAGGSHVAVAREVRQRLARDLHDSVKQQLFTLCMSTATAEARWDSDPDGARRALGEAREASRRAMVEMEALLRQLRPDPLAGSSLADALDEQCQALHYRSGAKVTFHRSALPPEDELPGNVRRTAFRIAQEALHNVGRHARAGRVEVVLARRREGLRAWLELLVEDDGQGFDPGRETGGLGRASMERRAREAGGGLSLASRPGGGCRVKARLPVPLPAPPDAGAAWRGDAETVSFLSVAAGIVATLVGLPVVAFLELHAAEADQQRVYLLLGGAFALVQIAFLLRVAAGARWNRLQERLEPDHPVLLRTGSVHALGAAWIGVVALTVTAFFLAWLPNQDLALVPAVACRVVAGAEAAAAAVWAFVHARRALLRDRALVRQMGSEEAAAERLKEKSVTLPLAAGLTAVLGLVVAAGGSPLLLPPLAVTAAFLLHRGRRLRHLDGMVSA